MYRTDVKYTERNTCVLGVYRDVEDLVREVDQSAFSRAYRDEHRSRDGVQWCGGTYETFQEGARGGLNRFTKRVEAMMDKFTNVALETHGIDFEYNEHFGALDRSAYEAGEDMCLFGPTHTDTVKAPIKVYVDQWISSTVPARVIETRGAAVMALVQALSLFRPVSLDIVVASGHYGTRTDTIQVIPAPTYTVNVSLSAWMLAAPDFMRVGMYSMIYDLVGSKKSDMLPMLNAGQTWQSTQLGNWLAKRDGVTQHVFLPMMFDNGIWGTEAVALNWVKSELKRLLGDAYVDA